MKFRRLLKPRAWLVAASLGFALLYGVHRAEGHLADAAPAALAVGSADPCREYETRLVDDDPETRPAGLTRVTRSLGSGGTLIGTLGALAPRATNRERFAQALGGVLDLHRLPPATGLVALIDVSGQIRNLTARAEPGRFVRVAQNGGDALHAVTIDVPLVRRVETAGGRVLSSIHQALDGTSHAEGLALAFEAIFQWNIDLFADPRPGDEFCLVYETLLLGQVPDDLPPFGGTVARAGEFVRLGRVFAAEYLGQIARSKAYWVSTEPDGEDGGYYDETGAPLRRAFLKSPLNYRRISSRFSASRMHPITHQFVAHQGIDFAAPRGTPVVAAADGRVISAGWDGPLGRAVRVRHGGGYSTVYGHLDRVGPGIRDGATVRQSQVIGFVGATGRATGPHLHYTLLHRGRPLDPLSFRAPEAEPLPPALRPALDRNVRAWSGWLDRHSAFDVVDQASAEPAGIRTATLAPATSLR